MKMAINFDVSEIAGDFLVGRGPVSLSGNTLS